MVFYNSTWLLTLNAPLYPTDIFYDVNQWKEGFFCMTSQLGVFIIAFIWLIKQQYWCPHYICLSPSSIIFHIFIKKLRPENFSHLSFVMFVSTHRIMMAVLFANLFKYWWKPATFYKILITPPDIVLHLIHLYISPSWIIKPCHMALNIVAVTQ